LPYCDEVMQQVEAIIDPATSVAWMLLSTQSAGLSDRRRCRSVAVASDVAPLETLSHALDSEELRVRRRERVERAGQVVVAEIGVEAHGEAGAGGLDQKRLARGWTPPQTMG
jgi:hypothetical protein